MKQNKSVQRTLKTFIILLLVVGLAVFTLPEINYLRAPGIFDQKEDNLSITLLSLPDSSFHQFIINNQDFIFEVANTSESKTQGLSNRDKIGSDGMLLVFQQPDRHGIWMKNMKFDLDLIWFLENEIVDFSLAVPAPEFQWTDEVSLPIYRPNQAADLVLEVSAGFVEENGLKIGDKLSITSLE
ncbi:MAG: hypothetical protein XD95_0434 [Microgenomates bacterium 39_7]|nr:MAG: hypothetical protein XD95_0434 [Microgenomates bacterium 39_7]